MIQPVFVSQKINDLLKIREKKSTNQQRVVYRFVTCVMQVITLVIR